MAIAVHGLRSVHHLRSDLQDAAGPQLLYQLLLLHLHKGSDQPSSENLLITLVVCIISASFVKLATLSMKLLDRRRTANTRSAARRAMCLYPIYKDLQLYCKTC